jgi:carbohydrate kinase (thermoresistant glucokinase family)
MGVTGCGKSTIGEKLAAALGIPFYDADDYHTESNKEKLTHDIPLNDADRQPWLEILAREMKHWEADGGGVLACSALKQSYRDTLRGSGVDVTFIYLKGDKYVFAKRIARRATHEPEALVKDYEHILDGQFRDLEEPKDAIIQPVGEPSPDQVVIEILEKLKG